MQNKQEKLIRIIRRNSRPIAPEPTGIEPYLSVPEGIKAVIFDIYGTLFCSSSGDIGTTGRSFRKTPFVEAVEAAGLSRTRSALRRTGAGDPVEPEYHRTIRRHHERLKKEGIEYPEIDIREIWSEVLAVLMDIGMIEKVDLCDDLIGTVAVEAENRLNPVWPMPDLEEMISLLRRKGYMLGIVSNAQFYTPLLFSALCSAGHVSLGFSDELCIWSFRMRQAKPSGVLYASLLDTLYRVYAVRPDESVFIGNDMLNDVYAAASAGMKTVLFAGDKRSLRMREEHPRCTEIQPDMIITGLEQLRFLL